MDDSRIARPTYDAASMTPGIAHFGVGNFHRSHQAMYLDRLMNLGVAMDWGIVGIGVMPTNATMRDALERQDYAYTLIEKAGDGSVSATEIRSICGYLFAQDDPARVLDFLSRPDIRIVSLTITEGGYHIDPASGEFDLHAEPIVQDLSNPNQPATVFGYITESLRRRRAEGTSPFTIVSCDNLPGNGDVTRRAVLSYAGALDEDLAPWIEQHVTFPNSMVDRITPMTTDAERELVRSRFGIVDAIPVVTEPFTQWVLEDDFCNGRPALERVGVQMVTDVEPYELTKLRMLNASHQAMAYAGILCGYTYVHEAVADPGIEAYLRAWLAEARQTLPPVPGIDIDDYIETLFSRFRNSAIADTLLRLASGASDKIPRFVLPAVLDNLSSGRHVPVGATLIATWMAFLRTGAAPEDALSDTLLSLAQHPQEFLRFEPVFGNLAGHQEFAESVLTSLEDIETGSIRTVLAAFV